MLIPARASRSATALAGTAAVAAALFGLAAGCGESRGLPACFAGAVCTWAGTGEAAFNGELLARADSALYWPMDLDFSPADGRAYILDWQNHRVRRVEADDRLRTVIGTDEIGDGPFTGDERTPPGVPGTSVNLNHPTDVAFAADGTVVLAAWHNHKVRHYDPATGLIDVTCGAGPGFKGDGGPAAMALMNQPKSAVVDPATGATYVLDTRNLRVRRIAAAAPYQIDTVVGVGTRGAGGDGGPPLLAQLSLQQASDNPEPGGGLALDARGRLYIVDTENQRVRRVDFAANTIETVAGNGVAGFSGDGGPAKAASLRYPRDAEIGPDGRLYIADTDNHRVRVVDLATGVITTFAGDGQQRFGGDGNAPAAASFNRPWGIAFDAAGSLYVADTFNNRIRKVMR